MKKILLIIALMFASITSTKAISLKRDYYDNIYYVQNGLPDYYMSDKQFHLSFNNLTAFCLDPKLKIMGYDYEEGNLDSLNFSEETKNFINKVIYYGYDYPGHQNVNYYMATQAIIWEHLSDFVVQFFTEQYGYGDSIDISNEKNEILELVNEHDKLPSFANKKEYYQNIDGLVYSDASLSNYELIESNYENAKIVGNSLIINRLDNYAGVINLTFKRKTYRNDLPKIYFMDGSQRMMSGGKLDDQIFTFTVEIKGHNVTINKLDKDSNKKIINSGVVINMQNIVSKEYIYVNGSKDISIPNDGTITLHGVPHGTYFITEVDTNSEYKLNNDRIRIYIDKDTEVNMYNSKEKGSIVITKYIENYDYDSNSYFYTISDDIKFNLYALEDIITKDGVVHYKKDQFIDFCISNGEICEFNNLILGKYYVKEEVPNDYIDDNGVYEFDLKESKNNHIEITNYLKKSNLIINKKDIDSNLLINNSEVYINIKNSNNDYIQIDGSKDIRIPDDGVLRIENIPNGEYTITEISTNNEYKLNEQEITVELDKDVEIDLYNEKEKGSIYINKLQEKYNYESMLYSYELGNNIKFNLYALDDIITKDDVIHYQKDELVDSCITENGKCSFDNLVLGKYYVKEEIPNDYIDNNEVYIFDLKEDHFKYYFLINYLKKSNLIINKKDIDSNLLINNSEVYINIKNSNNDYIQIDGSKDIRIPDNGVLKIENIPNGEYTITEINTNNEYKLNEQEIIVELDKDVEIDLYNEKEKGSIYINKLQEKYNYESMLYSYELGNNIKFNLYALDDIITKDDVIHYQKDALIDSCITENGKCLFDNLVLGKYYVKEEVPNGYIDDNSVYKFDLKENKDISIEIKNDVKKKDLIIEKVDSLTDKPIENVLFEIFFNSKSIGVFKTDNDGKIRLKNLPIGIYEVLEKETIEGYILDNERKVIDLNKDEILKISNDKKLIIPNALSYKNSLVKNIISSMVGIMILICLKYLR